jgi:hypothetical protein
VRGRGSRQRGCGSNAGEVRESGGVVAGMRVETPIWFDLASIGPNLPRYGRNFPTAAAPFQKPPGLPRLSPPRFGRCRRLPRPPRRCSPAPIWSTTTRFQPSPPLFVSSCPWSGCYCPGLLGRHKREGGPEERALLRKIRKWWPCAGRALFARRREKNERVVGGGPTQRWHRQIDATGIYVVLGARL